MNERLERLEIQIAWQADLLETLNQTVATLNRELGEQSHRIAALQEALLRQKDHAGGNPPGNEKPPHY